MGHYDVEKRESTAVNFFAGGFPIVTEIAIADETIGNYTPVAETDTGVAVATTETIDKIVGISSASAEKNEPLAFYMTGEFFEDALNIPEGIESNLLKKALRKISIYLK